MFEVQAENFGKLKKVKLLNTVTGEYANILPGSGSTLNELVLCKGGKLYPLLDGCSSYEDFMEEGKSVFKGPKLFPFPNRINRGRYTFENCEFQLPVNFPSEGHAIHGLLLDHAFEVTRTVANENKAVLEVSASGTDLPGYPFPFLLRIVFQLSAKGLLCKTFISNTGNTPMPVGDGWHPYFTFGGSIDKLKLQLPASKTALADNNMIPTGDYGCIPDFISPAPLSSKKLDTCFLIETPFGISETVITDTESNTDLVIWQESGQGKYNYLQVYTPPHRKSIAIEPMTCMPDAFNNHQGLLILQPGEAKALSFGVYLK